jgi:hypothetical protein
MNEEEKMDDENKLQDESFNLQEISNESSLEQQPETESEIKFMEVHHHPHVEKKSFKEYLLEGLMIFLAVIMGFIAENIREHFVNHETEKRSIEIVVNNLKDDVERLKKCISQNSDKIKVLDTIGMFSTKDKLSKDSVNKLIQLIYKCGPNFSFISNEAALEQMKSSGSLRFVNKKNVLDSIFHYEYVNKLINKNQDDCNQWSFTAHTNHTHLDLSVYEFYNSDILKQNMVAANSGAIYYRQQKVLATQCFSEFNVVKYILQNLIMPLLQQQLNSGNELIKLLKKEYHLNNE